MTRVLLVVRLTSLLPTGSTTTTFQQLLGTVTRPLAMVEAGPLLPVPPRP
jgi:hypothetical protein